MTKESDLIPFIILYTPFWSVPLLAFSLYFSRIYFKKGYFKTFICFLILLFISISFLLFFVLAGGPERAPKRFLELI